MKKTTEIHVLHSEQISLKDAKAQFQMRFRTPQDNRIFQIVKLFNCNFQIFSSKVMTKTSQSIKIKAKRREV